jgi:hypothetical protein
MTLAARLSSVLLFASALVIGCGGSATNPGPGGMTETSTGGASPTFWSACPAVAYQLSSAEILADFPLPFADAQTHTFHACRNDECYSLSLSDFSGGSSVSPSSVTGFQNGAEVEVWADREVIGVPSATSLPPAPYVMLRWEHEADSTDFTRTDEYKLSIDNENSGATSLFDTMVTYVKTTYTDLGPDIDPELCGAWGVATVDLRAVP